MFEVHAGMVRVRTPRFPEGILTSALKHENSDVQMETLIVWFLATHHPATGPYFSWAETGTTPTPPATIGRVVVADGPKGVGYGQGAYYSGVTPTEALTEFWKPFVSQSTLKEAAAVFGGTWERGPVPTSVDVDKPAAVREEVLARLDSLISRVEALPQPHGGIGHNRPDDLVRVQPSDRSACLAAARNMRVAVSQGAKGESLSRLWNTLQEACRPLWEAAMPALAILTKGFLQGAGKELGQQAAEAMLSIAGAWHDHESIRYLLEFLN